MQSTNLPDEEEKITSSSFSSEELQTFIDDMFATYIAQNDYDGYVGKVRCHHFRMYKHLQLLAS